MYVLVCVKAKRKEYVKPIIDYKKERCRLESCQKDITNRKQQDENSQTKKETQYFDFEPI